MSIIFAVLSDNLIARLSLINPIHKNSVLIYPIYEIIPSGITINLIFLRTCSLSVGLFKCEL